MRSPNPAQWVWYAWGGTLPQRYQEWVLRDITRPSWMWRHLARALAQGLPILAVVFVLLVPVFHIALWIGLAAIAIGLIVSVYYSISYAWEHGDQRLLKYGYPPAHGTRIRRQRELEKTRALADRYNAQWRT